MDTASTDHGAIWATLEIMGEGTHDHIVACSATDDIDEMLYHAHRANEWTLRRLLYAATCIPWIGEMPD